MLIIKQTEIKKYRPEIEELATGGMNCSRIAKQLGMDDCALRYFLTRNKINTVKGQVKSYTLEDEQTIITLYTSGVNYKVIAQQLCLGYRTVHLILRQAGVVKQPRTTKPTVASLRTEDNDLILKLYSQEKSCKDISLATGIREGVVNSVINKHGLIRSRCDASLCSRGYKIDKNAFSDFSTEQAAYFYGFLLADGCITKTKYGHKVAICLNIKDKEVLFKMQDYLGMNYGISDSSVYDKRTEKTYHRSILSFGNPEIISRLIGQGLAPQKSTKEVLPSFNWLTNKHFWRGVVDGDGHVRIAKKASALVLVGSEEVVSGFLLFCKETVGLITERTPSFTGSENNLLYKVQLTGEDARNIANYLYSDSTVYLERKKTVALTLID